MNIPEKIKTLFASATGALKSIIPETGTVNDTEASMQMGFPPRTMSQGADKTPPTGQDMNGILYKITEAIRYLQAGGIYAYDNNFVQAIGGYPLGAVLISADGSKLWKNQVAGNTTNPDLDDTNWLELCTVDALIAGLDGKLSLTGGMMTGALQSNISYGAVILNWQGNPIVGIGGSSDQTFLSCPDGTKYLRVGDDGTATWAGKELERIAEISISNYEGYIRYSGGLQMCWGSVTRSGSAGDVTVTFPKAFSTVPICQVSRSASANTTGGADEIFLRSVSTTSTNIYFPIGTNARWFAIGAWS